MPTIPTTSALTGGGTTATQKTTSSTMGKDDFLKLMTTQLRRQDPMKPVDDTAFLAQMAQFTSLEQLTNLGTTASQQLNAAGVTQALALAGRTVDYLGSDGTTRTGVVDSVSFDGGVPQLTIGGVPGISPGAVAAVHGGAPGTPAAGTGTTTSTPSSTATGGDATTTTE
ncbi:flagellar hook capping FlgD N-terminal domain-containing protein [Patulibacter minatonensis]|uniref:flagellar hook capping FlgD N-terminal domain-containing protein n=1 Tax=Patulibacter minatonensis TaxID=298163 RepID=UPI0004BAF128|nr:flagellar hook capping FlgD N-terminal domain-containing protein [Patulibacter minatonensis]